MADAPLPEEAKPEAKPRNWRGYTKEYIVIVVGVLTALAAQQAADWLRWESEVKQARQALYSEIAINTNNAFLRRAAYAPCLVRQVAEAARILDDLEAKRPPGRLTVFHSGAHTLLNDSEWPSEREAQTLTHFPRAELAQLGSWYAMLPLLRSWLDQETAAWHALSVLRSPPTGLSADELSRLRGALATAQWAGNLITLNVGRQLRVSRALGISDTPPDKARVEKFCTLNEEDWFRYIQSLEPRP